MVTTKNGSVRKQNGFFSNLVLDTLRAEARRTARPIRTVGFPGTSVLGGFIQSIEDNSRLVGREKYKTFSEFLANVTIVAAGVRYFLNMLAKADWIAEPADHPQGQEFAERTEEALFNGATPWKRVVRRAGMSRFHGFSIQEWTAGRQEDGSLGFTDIAPRPQITIERWDVDETGRVLGVVQRSPQTVREVYLPREKVVYVVDDTINDSPEGLGLFRHISEACRKLVRYEQLEGFGYELDLRGVPVGRAPLAALNGQVTRGQLSQAKVTQLLQPLTDFIKGHIKSPQLGLLLDSVTYRSTDDASTPSGVRQWDMELLTGSNTSQGDIARAILRLNQETARVLGVENLLVGGDGVGSLALSRDKSENFGLLVDSALGELAEAFERDLLDVLFMLNGWPLEAKPELKPESIQHRDVAEITEAIRNMAMAGAMITPEDPVVDNVRDLLGVSRQETIATFEDLALGGAPPEEDELPIREPEGDEQ